MVVRDISLLNFSPSGIMEYDTAIEEYKIMKRHQYKVWYNEKLDVWMTYLPDCDGRKQIKRKRKSDLVKAIDEFYKQADKKIFFQDAFDRWLAEKVEYGEIGESSRTKYQATFRKHFVNNPFAKIELSRVNEADVERFIKLQIKEKQLTRKGYDDLRIILTGTLKYAKSKGYTKFSIGAFMNDLVLPKRLFASSKIKTDENQVYSELETETLVHYLWTHDEVLANLGLIFMFQSGIRVGELAVLKWGDVDGDLLRVRRTAVSYKDEDGKRVVAEGKAAKTEAGVRTVMLPAQAKLTLKAAKRFNPFAKETDYIFVSKGKQISTRAFNYWLKKACDEVGIPYRSTHKIRKTYGSCLIENGVDEKIITNQMGHTDIGTTKQYYNFNRKNRETVSKIITEAIPF